MIDDQFDQAQCRLRNNLHVYALGDFYAIPDLKQTACTKFSTVLVSFDEYYMSAFLEKNVVMTAMALIVEEVFKVTKEGETIRRAVVQHTAQNRQYFAKSRTFIDHASKIDDFMSSFMIETAASYEAETVTKVKNHESENRVLNGVKRNFEAFMQDQYSLESGMLSRFCRHCHQQGTAKPEQKAGVWKARCTQCGTWYL